MKDCSNIREYISHYICLLHNVAVQFTLQADKLQYFFILSAVCSSSEPFDTNTDVPAESDDYFSVIVSPSVQIDVDTGDASGDNSLELEQSDTDITITVSNSTANGSEDEIITINVEISESTGDAPPYL